MLERSLDVPLTVQFETHAGSASPGSDKGFGLVLDHSRRLKSLSIVGTMVVQRLIQDSVHPAPLLHTLVIGTVRRDYIVPSIVRLAVPNDLFSGHTPRLQHLYIVGMDISPSSPLLRNLSSLSLCLHPNSPRWTANELLTVLSQMPLLKSLELKNAVSITSGRLPSASLTVHLKYLECIRFAGRLISDSGYLLHRLTLPSTAHIHLSALAESSHDLLSPWPIIPPYAPTAAGGYPLIGLELSFESGFELVGIVYDKEKKIYHRVFSINIDLVNRHITSHEVASSLCNQIRIHDVRTIRLAVGDASDWAPALRKFPMVRTISVRGTTWYPVVQSLAASFLDESGSVELLCPHLHTLTFKWRGWHRSLNPSFFEGLAIALDTRRARGTDISELFIEGEKIPCDDLNALRTRKLPKEWCFV
ncbi:hypothetical protein EW146_g8106 [Bondarzewia mesenterica]|uniref:F-box domain-containing protein n=1 Tax=Bondarzewia mesenterica TaxID=1095465 RepID=A0A4S4LHL1_9AGAM|nr:hypothetical protein EW146_g8106 [Bondarzewia mesenterica]